MPLNKSLAAYAVGVSAALVFVLVTGATLSSAPDDELTVRRINIVEADGTIRMVISSDDAAPGLIAHNVDRPHPSGQRPGGMLFFNDDGTEMGGLIFTGEEGDEHPVNWLQLSFDSFEQDQAVTLRHIQDQGQYLSGLEVTDRSEVPYDFDAMGALADMSPEERQAAMDEMASTGQFDSARRVFVGRTRDGASVLVLRDGEGRIRMRFSVSEDGAVTAVVLDEDGEVVRDLLM